MQEGLKSKILKSSLRLLAAHRQSACMHARAKPLIVSLRETMLLKSKNLKALSHYCHPLLCAAKLHILLVQPDKNVVFIIKLKDLFIFFTKIYFLYSLYRKAALEVRAAWLFKILQGFEKFRIRGLLTKGDQFLWL